VTGAADPKEFALGPSRPEGGRPIDAWPAPEIATSEPGREPPAVATIAVAAGARPETLLAAPLAGYAAAQSTAMPGAATTPGGADRRSIAAGRRRLERAPRASDRGNRRRDGGLPRSATRGAAGRRGRAARCRRSRSANSARRFHAYAGPSERRPLKIIPTTQPRAE